MFFFVDYFAVQYTEGIQVDTLVQREDGIADGGVVGQAEIFLRGTRGEAG